MVIKKLKNINFLDEEGRTQLHDAARHGVLDICKLIVRYVDDWNPKNEKGETPLDLAVKNGETATVEFFRSLQAKKSRMAQSNTIGGSKASSAAAKHMYFMP